MDKRKYLTPYEVSKLLCGADKSRNPERNYCMILMAYRHGFRISELLSIKLSDIDMNARVIFINRLKNGFSVAHPCSEDEYDMLQKWLNIRRLIPESAFTNNVFISSSGRKISRTQAWKIIKKCGEIGGLSLHVHPHMLRHSCGYYLAGRGTDTRLIQDYLGHRNIRHTVLYTQSNFKRFEKLSTEYIMFIK
ncbi:tyrosine-type recombinase/integrase [Enterobacter ludwigii]|uniref:tyrosine-type recombinase/integrase n=1 Tax=Enterobacter ludwigii TaxID=299767 RepID=UPI002A80A855|nr:tyrosine-type recombinase/integrase [Enterobacter ludwigii]